MTKKLRIAMFCTNEWPTPPPPDTFYAPLWIAHAIAEGMTRRGHHVDYYGARGSKITARLVDCGMPALKSNRQLQPFLKHQNEAVVNFYEQLMLSKIYAEANRGRYDCIHIHPYRRAIQYAGLTQTPTIFTLHDPITGFAKYMLEQTRGLPQVSLVSISNAQRRPAPHLNYAGTVYNGIDISKFRYTEKPGNHLVAAGRFVPEKGIDLAVRVAYRAKVPLHLSGGKPAGPYWERDIKPYLGRRGTRYVGMLQSSAMGKFYGQGKALLYPLRWEEPFGLVLAEAMACGTPVIAFPHGSIPEIVKHGVTGYIVRTLPEMVAAVKKIDAIDRRACRRWVEQKFTIKKMVDGYEKVYEKILQRHSRKN